MNAIEFMHNLTEKTTFKPRELSAEEYFQSDQGKRMIQSIKDKVRVIDDKCFTIDDWDLQRIQKNPLYKGRIFFHDMDELGFIYDIISYHQDEAPIKTYKFQIK